MQRFKKLTAYGECEASEPPTCTAIPLNQLEWNVHHSKDYYITIRVTNTAGLVTRATSKPYKHTILAPSKGIVIDVDISKQDQVSDLNPL